MSEFDPVALFGATLDGDWRSALQSDEWLFTRIRERVQELAAPRAFDRIGPAVHLLLRQKDPYLQVECGWLVVALVRASATTEVPDALREHWLEAMTLLRKVDETTAASMATWYRQRSV